jgi:hypothetical protein
MFRAPARESGLGAFIQLCWDSSQASVAHLPHPVIAYSWGAALNLVAYPVISCVNILAFGPNGSGKGTQGAIVKEKYGIDHIESGAIFREHIKGGTELGKKAKAYIDRGDLVPDDITIPMVLETLGKSPRKKAGCWTVFPAPWPRPRRWTRP